MARFHFDTPMRSFALVTDLGAHEAERQLDLRTAMAAIERAILDPRARRAIDAVCQRVSPKRIDGRDAGAVRAMVLDTLERALRRRALIAIEVEPRRPAVDRRTPLPQPLPPKEPEPHPELTWIEITVVDEHDQPVKNRPYRLQLGDGSVREGVLGDDGLLRLDGLKPGDCTLTLPTEDVDKWALVA